MKRRFKVELLSNSAILNLSNDKRSLYTVEIGPRRSAEYFANIFLEGAFKIEDLEVDVKGISLTSLGESLCQVALFEDHGLFKCSTRETGESRNIEIFPKDFAVWLAKCLEARPKTKVEYEIF